MWQANAPVNSIITAVTVRAGAVIDALVSFTVTFPDGNTNGILISGAGGAGGGPVTRKAPPGCCLVGLQGASGSYMGATVVKWLQFGWARVVDVQSGAASFPVEWSDPVGNADTAEHVTIITPGICVGMVGTAGALLDSIQKLIWVPPQAPQPAPVPPPMPAPAPAPEPEPAPMPEPMPIPVPGPAYDPSKPASQSSWSAYYWIIGIIIIAVLIAGGIAYARSGKAGGFGGSLYDD